MLWDSKAFWEMIVELESKQVFGNIYQHIGPMISSAKTATFMNFPESYAHTRTEVYGQE